WFTPSIPPWSTRPRTITITIVMMASSHDRGLPVLRPTRRPGAAAAAAADQAVHPRRRAQARRVIAPLGVAVRGGSGGYRVTPIRPGIEKFPAGGGREPSWGAFGPSEQQ